MKIKALNLSGDKVLWLQWSRFKRREKSIFVFIWGAFLLHAIFWIVWHFFIAPYPIALRIPLPFSFPGSAFFQDYLWPLVNTALLVLNTYLAFKIYKKDIFAGWLMIGGNIFLQVFVLSMALYLAILAAF